MQAIITRILPATNTKPTRIKASCERDSIIYSLSELPEGDPHIMAARELCATFIAEDRAIHRIEPEVNPWGRAFVTGELPNGDRVHVDSGAPGNLVCDPRITKVSTIAELEQCAAKLGARFSADARHGCFNYYDRNGSHAFCVSVRELADIIASDENSRKADEQPAKLPHNPDETGIDRILREGF